MLDFSVRAEEIQDAFENAVNDNEFLTKESFISKNKFDKLDIISNIIDVIKSDIFLKQISFNFDIDIVDKEADSYATLSTFSKAIDKKTGKTNGRYTIIIDSSFEDTDFNFEQLGALFAELELLSKSFSIVIDFEEGFKEA